MAAPKELDSTASIASLLGAKVRKHRQRLGWTQRELGDRVHVAHNRVAQIELATDPPTWDLCIALDAVLAAEGELTELWDHMAREKARIAFPDWAQKFMFLEAKATRICQYSAHTVLGLLQTEAYARVALRAGLPRASADEIEGKVAARINRQGLLRKAPAPLLWVILDEAVIRRPVGGPHVMYDQLGHLVEMAQTSDVIVQVMPFERGEHSVMGGSLTLLGFADGPDVAYLEGIGSAMLVESADEVTEHALAYDLAQASALTPDESITWLKTAMEDCYACTRHTST